MSMYIVFFGKSQDFTACYYDRNNKIDDFNTIIKDFDLLESKTFTVDDIDTGEILSRYLFNSKGREYCLLKLYSFAQAYSGNRIAGSIYGVGLLSDCTIHLSKDNLALMRAAKDNFAKLSLEGVKFKRSNFQDDTNRIWRAIVTNSEGNLLDKISTSILKSNGSDGSISFYVKNLFQDAIKLDERSSTHDEVYFSEDLKHLKRTQDKWGVKAFPIYQELNEQIVAFESGEPTLKKQNDSFHSTTSTDKNDIVKLRAALDDYQHDNHHLKRDIKKFRVRLKTLTYTIYGLSGLILTLLSLWTFFGNDKEIIIQTPTTAKMSSQEKTAPLSRFLEDKASVDSAIVLFSNADFIFSFDTYKQQYDTLKLQQKFKGLERLSTTYGFNIANVKKIYEDKSAEIQRQKNDVTLRKESQKRLTNEQVKPAKGNDTK
jgi:hypothetical protein